MEAEIIWAGEGWRIIHDDLLAAGVTPNEGDTLFTRLYVQDGSHPSPHGTYLAACIAYATVTGQSPVGLSWAHPGISAEDKARLQAVAAEVAVGLGDRPDDSDDPDDTDPTDSPTTDSSDIQSDRNENAPAPGSLCGCASHSRPPATLVWGFLAVILAGQRRRPTQGRNRRADDSRW
jgi:MYXO-CTERM domain-containing protein